jgi:MoaA/NifB/PqqE/SkfB family radical SAM enzyme
MLNSYEAYIESMRVENNQTEDLLKKIDLAVRKAVGSGKYEAIIEVDAYNNDSIQKVIKDLKAHGYHVHLEDFILNGYSRETFMEVNWKPSRYNRFQAWLDKMTEKVGVIFSPNV